MALYILSLNGKPSSSEDRSSALTSLSIRVLDSPGICQVNGWSMGSNECIQLPCQVDFNSMVPPFGSYGTCPTTTTVGGVFMSSGSNCTFACTSGYVRIGSC